MKNAEAGRLAKIIWDYHKLNMPLKKADAIFVLGSHDLTVADRGAELFLGGWAPIIIFSGGFGRFTAGVFEKSEADAFAMRAIELGVPEDRIIIENKSSNTGENITFTKRLLEEKGINFQTFILVQKPYMERRAFATFRKLWPEKECIVTSPQVTFEEYCRDQGAKKVINRVVGDLQRIIEYPKKGYQIPQEVPKEVMDAYEKLVEAGYNEQVIYR